MQQEKNKESHKRKPLLRLLADFSAKILQARREWHKYT